MRVLIADSGSTKCEWCLVTARSAKTLLTQGMSPYFLGPEQMEQVIGTELLPQLKNQKPEAVYFYGTGMKDPRNALQLTKVLKKIFPAAQVMVTHDLLGAARALCQAEKGIACILGTGSNSCLYDGRKILNNSPGLGYVLGDEGSGSYLGKKLIQYYLYGLLEKPLGDKFEKEFGAGAEGILEQVYRKPLPNRYLAGFTTFLSANRGHYLIENIIEDGLNDFFSYHVSRYPRAEKYPVHFTGSIAWYFRDIVLSLCDDYQLRPGAIIRSPMEGLIKFHRK